MTKSRSKPSEKVYAVSQVWLRSPKDARDHWFPEIGKKSICGDAWPYLRTTEITQTPGTFRCQRCLVAMSTPSDG